MYTFTMSQNPTQAENANLFVRRLQKNINIIQLDTSELTLLHRKSINVLFHNYIQQCAYYNVDHLDEVTIPIDTLKQLTNYKNKNGKSFFAEMRRMKKCSVYCLYKQDDETIQSDITLIHYIEERIEKGVFVYEVSKRIMNILYNPQTYTTLMLGIARIFTSKHSLSLWENCHCYLYKKESPFFDIDSLKKLLGVSKKYEEFKVFNQKVLKKAIDEVNNISDLAIEPIYRRDSKRNITHIAFKINRNPANNQGWIKEYPESIQGTLFDLQNDMASKFWIKKIQAK